MFCVLRNFLRISQKFCPNFNFVFRENFAERKENFAKHEIDNFATFSRKHENEKFRSHFSFTPSTRNLAFFLYVLNQYIL